MLYSSMQFWKWSPIFLPGIALGMLGSSGGCAVESLNYLSK